MINAVLALRSESNRQVRADEAVAITAGNSKSRSWYVQKKNT